MNPLRLLEAWGIERRKILGAYAQISVGKSFVQSGVPAELSCAVVVNAICNEALGFPVGGGASTILMYKTLRTSLRWREVKLWEAENGDIILSPTQGDNTGHVGICGRFDPVNKYPQEVYSNNSLTGLWDAHWGIGSWWNYYVYKKGLQMKIYRLMF